MSRPTERLSSMISDLGGPIIPATDMDWAMDIPAGRALLEWVADQLALEVDGLDQGFLVENIALHADEVQILDRAKKSYPIPQDPVDPTNVLHVAPSYATPLRLKERAEFMDAESALLESEANLLKARIRQTKQATQKSSRTVESLRAAIAKADENIQEMQDKLAELSLTADTAISSSVGDALRLLTDNGTDRMEIVSHQPLQTLSSRRSSIINVYNSQMTRIDASRARLLTAEEVKKEAGRLHDVLGPLMRLAEDAAYDEEIARMCKRLEDVRGDSSLDDVLELKDVLERDESDVGIDIKKELEQAWMFDQLSLVEARGKTLDDTINAFNSVIDPLKTLHDGLSTTDAHIRELEAISGALGEELEDVVDDVKSVVRQSSDNKEEEEEDAIWERELIDLLKRLKDLRAQFAPPLILLNRADVINELKSTISFRSELQDEEEKWVKTLPGTLSEISASHSSLLSAIYANSPVPTSPPFAPALDIRELEKRASEQSDALGDVLSRVRKDGELFGSARTVRKLDAFVDKWGRSHKSSPAL